MCVRLAEQQAQQDGKEPHWHLGNLKRVAVAQYDIIFLKNNAVSGVSYTEFYLSKPPSNGYALTQKKDTGQICWEPALMAMGELEGSDDLNDCLQTGFYMLKGSKLQSAPKYTEGILVVWANPEVGVVFQTAYVIPGTAGLNTGMMFVRHITDAHNEWTEWSEVRLNAGISQSGENANSLLRVENVTGNYTIQSEDHGKYIRWAHEKMGDKISLPYDSHTDVPIGSTIIFEIISNAYLSTLFQPMYEVGGDEAILRSRDNMNRFKGQFSVVTVVKTGSNEWTLYGDLQ